MTTLRIIGPGRAGLSLSGALADAGWTVLPPRGRGDDLTDAASGVDLLVLATPDAAVAHVAAAVTPVPTTVVAHLSGSLGLDVLAPHARRASVHPLVAIPDVETGRERLVAGASFAVAGDPLARTVVSALHGLAFEVPEDRRVAYHAAACIASNHLVALLAQVERVAMTTGVPLSAYLDLVRATVDNVEKLGVERALTGPVARGDWETVARHRDALDPDEVEAYQALADAAARVAGHAPAGAR